MSDFEIYDKTIRMEAEAHSEGQATPQGQDGETHGGRCQVQLLPHLLLSSPAFLLLLPWSIFFNDFKINPIYLNGLSKSFRGTQSSKLKKYHQKDRKTVFLDLLMLFCTFV